MMNQASKSMRNNQTSGAWALVEAVDNCCCNDRNCDGSKRYICKLTEDDGSGGKMKA